MQAVFIYGPPASGKLTIALELAKITGYRVFPNHEVIRLLSSLFPYDDPRLSATRTLLSRDIRLKIFGEATRQGVNLITTFGMSGPNYFDFFHAVKDVVEQAGGTILFVQATAPEHVLLERVSSESRIGHKIDSKEHLAQLLNDHPEIYSKFPDVDHLTVDSSNISPYDTAMMIHKSLIMAGIEPKIPAK